MLTLLAMQLVKLEITFSLKTKKVMANLQTVYHLTFFLLSCKYKRYRKE